MRAAVFSMGDARSYYLTTARNDLGVIFAESELGTPQQPFTLSATSFPSLGTPMVPISWQEMMCPVTKVREARKCAKP